MRAARILRPTEGVMATVAFEKWEGLGNDFILVADDQLSIEQARQLAPRWCDRRLGIGADGILLVGTDQPSMIVLNADGTRPEMCGNGIRCVAGLLATRQGIAPTAILSDAGLRDVRLFGQPGRTVDVEVAMGYPSLAPHDAGVTVNASTATQSTADESQQLPDEPFSMRAEEVDADGFVVSVGNPHWIFLGETPRDVTTFGPALEHDPRFTNRTNVEWVTKLGPNHYRVDVWERGSGRTFACGTGATAVAFLLHRLGAVAPREPVRITLPGGDLRIRIEPDGRAWMRGPARRVFRGEIATTPD